MSLSKTKLHVVNGSVDCNDLQLLFIGVAAEVISDFQCFEVVVVSKGEIMMDAEERIALASEDFVPYEGQYFERLHTL